jgi:hypothetical protein
VDWCYLGSIGAFICVFGPNDDNDRKQLLDELVELISWCEMQWCIGDDFNVTRYPCERSSDN